MVNPVLADAMWHGSSANTKALILALKLQGGVLSSPACTPAAVIQQQLTHTHTTLLGLSYSGACWRKLLGWTQQQSRLAHPSAVSSRRLHVGFPRNAPTAVAEAPPCITVTCTAAVAASTRQGTQILADYVGSPWIISQFRPCVDYARMSSSASLVG
jgi:hypothetical protein